MIALELMKMKFVGSSIFAIILPGIDDEFVGVVIESGEDFVADKADELTRNTATRARVRWWRIFHHF